MATLAIGEGIDVNCVRQNGGSGISGLPVRAALGEGGGNARRGAAAAFLTVTSNEPGRCFVALCVRRMLE